LIRKLFKTTNNEDADMAAAAYIGDRFPLAAIGIPTKLYKNAQPRFDLITLTVFFEIAKASNAASRDGPVSYTHLTLPTT
jgi:hypothetical protein